MMDDDDEASSEDLSMTEDLLFIYFGGCDAITDVSGVWVLRLMSGVGRELMCFRLVSTASSG